MSACADLLASALCFLGPDCLTLLIACQLACPTVQVSDYARVTRLARLSRLFSISTTTAAAAIAPSQASLSLPHSSFCLSLPPFPQTMCEKCANIFATAFSKLVNDNYVIDKTAVVAFVYVYTLISMYIYVRVFVCVCAYTCCGAVSDYTAGNHKIE